MSRITWYFDFISPYSYFALRSLDRFAAPVKLQPILFAGLLNRWGQKGPAEIPPKRVWTYRSCVWWAQHNGVPFRMPAAHPFNSLPFLRLAIAAGGSRAAIVAIFEALWTTGADAADPHVLADLARSLDVGLDRITDPFIKHSLREGTQEAERAGVFGVPTLSIDGELFWGNDAMDFAAQYLKDPELLRSQEMLRAAALPIGVARTPN